MKKRLVSLLACGVLSASAIACTVGCGKKVDVITLTVWGSANQQATLTQMAEEFKKANPDKNYDIKIGVGEEDMAYSNVGKDPSAAADVYSYSNDQLIPLLRIGALARVGGTYLDSVKSANSADSVKAGSVDYGTADEKVYGYPYASDNGYFMFYDKSVLSETDVASLESIISICERESKKIAWALDVPWYTAGWFFAFGCSYSVEYDYSANYTESNIEIDFNSENGIKASKAMSKLTKSSAFAGKNTSDETIITGFCERKTAVAVSGTWNAKKLQEILGDDYGVCKLPTVTVDGETKQLYSFRGYKLLGVNQHCANPAEAHKLALFLSSEAMQKERFEQHLIGPTNTVIANLDSVKNDPTFAVLNVQNGYAFEQTSVPSSFWEPLKGYGLNVIDDLVAENPNAAQVSYQTQLDKMVAQIKNSSSSN